MLKTTADLVRQHKAYLQAHPNSAAELNQFETLYDHMFYYFTDKLGMTDDEATAVVKDFYADIQRAPDI